ncbi:tRNA (adenine-N(1)-)-methyltransferase catalytic subunit trm61 [Agyrium rufum]|nr:tRNA (adenine-N(1)-)-methyltransferase catalytic subunit trm61 [Agyrium rufum]
MALQEVHRGSPFLQIGPYAEADALAVLYLKRDLQLPIVLRENDEEDEGYDEGKVTNSRFGSFPHSTLIGLPWGSQVRASTVDTGSRGRRLQTGQALNGCKKRKREDPIGKSFPADPGTPSEAGVPKAAVTATTGFAHLLPPTPESWTASLPHRTQVVYTPDYSYILQRLRVRPGMVLIEAGAGSGSFSHAAARSVFNGYPQDARQGVEDTQTSGGRSGKVWSYEFHEPRYDALRTELSDHGLEGVIELTHRDVCAEGFAVEERVQADAVFLDLPAPWLALEYLTRSPRNLVKKITPPISDDSAMDEKSFTDNENGFAATQPSVLNPESAVRICTFSPCIEQVQRTISTMRQLGWLEISMVEIAAKRIEVRRERVGLQEEGLRGVNASAASVDEALGRLRELDSRTREIKEMMAMANKEGELVAHTPSEEGQSRLLSKQERREQILQAQEGRKIYKEGNLVHRSEADIKMHTSYLVFAVLPRAWTEEDEKKARDQWPVGGGAKESFSGPLSKRQRKKAAKEAAGGKNLLEQITLAEP